MKLLYVFLFLFWLNVRFQLYYIDYFYYKDINILSANIIQPKARTRGANRFNQRIWKVIFLRKKLSVIFRFLNFSLFFERKSNSIELSLVNNSSIIMPVKKELKLLTIQKEILVCYSILRLFISKAFLFFSFTKKKSKSTFLRKDEIKQNAMDSLYRSSLSNTVSFCLKYNKELNEVGTRKKCFNWTKFKIFTTFFSFLLLRIYCTALKI